MIKNCPSTLHGLRYCIFGKVSILEASEGITFTTSLMETQEIEESSDWILYSKFELMIS